MQKCAIFVLSNKRQCDMNEDLKMLMAMADANDPRLPEVYSSVLERAKRDGRSLDEFKDFNSRLVASVDKRLDNINSRIFLS